MKILVIDDCKEDRELAITYIHKTNTIPNILTDESNCLEDALNKIEKNYYDVIILDLLLPRSDGIETIKKTQSFLRKQEKNIPIIILTGLEDLKLGRKALGLGIKEFLIKDELQIDDLSRAIKCATYGKKIEKITA